MDYFGINSSDELPKINEVLAEQVVMPTLVNAEHFEIEGEQVQDAIEQNDDTNAASSNDGGDTDSTTES
jgi:segregation and condensation protein B